MVNFYKLNNKFVYKALLFIYFSIFIYFSYIASFNSSFDLLTLKDIDDYIYHISLREIHINIYNFEFYKLLNCNNWAYGWFFWISYGILTFPFFLIFNFSGLEEPLIIFSRIINISFAMGGAFYFYKICNIFKINQLNNLLINLLPLTYSGLIFLGFSRFGTTSMEMFFSTLVLYNIFKETNFNKTFLLKISFLLSLTIGIKLSNLIILAPIIYFLIFWKFFKFKINLISFKNFAILTIYLIAFSTILYNPNIFFNHEIFIFELKKFIELSKRNYLNYSFIECIDLLTNLFYLNFSATFFLFIFSKNLINKKIAEYQILSIVLIGNLFISTYLIINHPQSCFVYIFSIFYFQLIPIIFVAKHTKYSTIYILIILITNLTYPNKAIFDRNELIEAPLYKIYYFYKEIYKNNLSSNKNEICSIIKEKIKNNPQKTIMLGVNYYAPSCYSPLSLDNTVIVNYIGYNYDEFFFKNTNDLQFSKSYEYILSKVLPNLFEKNFPSQVPKNKVYFDYLILDIKTKKNIFEQIKKQNIINQKKYIIIKETNDYAILESHEL